MHARSALFDLYGDHLRVRDDRAPVAALVRLLASLGIAPPAVRTAISRMVRQGWLEPVRLSAGRGYALTDRARHRLDDAAARIYRTQPGRWDGAWDLLVLDPLGQRTARERVRTGLTFLGYAPLSDSTWISPFVSRESDDLLQGERAGFVRFRAHDDAPAERAGHAWDLESLAKSYTAWRDFAGRLLADPDSTLPGITGAGPDERAFAVRSVLVHEWRKFLFTDPGLPAELLPADWVGHEAARFFADHAARLLPAASTFVDACLSDHYKSGDDSP
ncbi:MAG: PaaX family transcriptional regulator C-terminal domain-containing protein [Nocardioidaceae bacterium]